MKLYQLSRLSRAGLVFAVLVLYMGVAASVTYIYTHYEKRDERPGLTIDDVKAAYHGLEAPAELVAALERNHPADLPEASRKVLVSWLKGAQVAENFDNLDFGDETPKEIIAQSCVSCHARTPKNSAQGYPKLPLENWDDVKQVAFGRNLAPTAIGNVIVSTHAHALALGIITIGVILAAAGTRFPRGLVGGLGLLAGLGLLVDIGCWWLTRWQADFAWGIIGGGAMFNGGLMLLLTLILLDLLRPAPRST